VGKEEEGKKTPQKSFEIFYNLGVKKYNLADYDKSLNLFEQSLKAFKNMNKSVIEKIQIPQAEGI
jgi:hypothetical protein